MNIHLYERWARVIVGFILCSLAFVGPQNYWFLIGLLPIVTGLAGWCPPYALIGINTCKLGK
jgi:hypothetical protein